MTFNFIFIVLFHVCEICFIKFKCILDLIFNITKYYELLRKIEILI